MTKGLVKSLESINTRLWQTAILFEKMRHKVEDIEGKAGVLRIKYDDHFQVKSGLQEKVSKALRELAWQLSLMDEKSQELAQSIDSIVDDLESI